MNEQNQYSIQILSEKLKTYCPDYKVSTSTNGVKLIKGMQKTSVVLSNNTFNIKSTNLMLYIYGASLIVIILCIGWLMGKRKDDIFFMMPSIIGIIALFILIYNILRESSNINLRISNLMKMY